MKMYEIEPMKYNKSGIKFNGKNRDYKKIAEKLWSLLDDIDSAGDCFHPEQTNYFNYVNKKTDERHKLMQSDGYNLK